MIILKRDIVVSAKLRRVYPECFPQRLMPNSRIDRTVLSRGLATVGEFTIKFLEEKSAQFGIRGCAWRIPNQAAMGVLKKPCPKYLAPGGERLSGFAEDGSARERRTSPQNLAGPQPAQKR